jgi:hypothetical protein
MGFYIPEDGVLHSYHSKNLKSCAVYILLYCLAHPSSRTIEMGSYSEIRDPTNMRSIETQNVTLSIVTLSYSRINIFELHHL